MVPYQRSFFERLSPPQGIKNVTNLLFYAPTPPSKKWFIPLASAIHSWTFEVDTHPPPNPAFFFCPHAAGFVAVFRQLTLNHWPKSVLVWCHVSNKSSHVTIGNDAKSDQFKWSSESDTREPKGPSIVLFFFFTNHISSWKYLGCTIRECRQGNTIKIISIYQTTEECFSHVIGSGED